MAGMKAVVGKGEEFFQCKKLSMEKTMQLVEQCLLVDDPKQLASGCAAIKEGVQLDTTLASEVAAIVKILKLMPIVGKLVYSLLNHPGDPKKCFDKASEMTREMRKEWGKIADSELLPPVFLKKVSECLAVQAKCSNSKASKDAKR
eukprot:5097455-Amphidinium_carterae.1